MTSLGNIYQSIEILSKEKGIDPQIVLDAVKDANVGVIPSARTSDEMLPVRTIGQDAVRVLPDLNMASSFEVTTSSRLTNSTGIGFRQRRVFNYRRVSEVPEQDSIPM